MDRRSLQTFLFALALLIKVFTPFAATAAMANASADALLGTPICSGELDPGHGGQVPTHHGHEDCCLLCQCCHAHHAIGVMPVAVFTAQRTSHANSYAPRLFVLSRAAIRITAQARAPPHFS